MENALHEGTGCEFHICVRLCYIAAILGELYAELEAAEAEEEKLVTTPPAPWLVAACQDVDREWFLKL